MSIPSRDARRSGLKRTFANRDVASRNPYHDGWMPPGRSLKRMGIPLENHQIAPGPRKMQRLDHHRSYSTSSVPPSSSSSSPSASSSSTSSSSSSPSSSHSPSVRDTPREFTKSAALNSKRTMSASEVRDRTRDSKQIVSNNYKGLPRSTGIHKRFDIYDSIKSQTSDAVAANKLKKSTNELRTEGANPKTEQSNKVAGTSSASKAKSDRVHSDLMSNKIWTYYQENKQSEQQAIAKERMRRELEACIRRRFPKSDLILGGSSMNGFGSKSCDADLCLYLWDISPNESRNVLLTLRSYLQSAVSNVLLTNMKIIFAKVPILKFKYHHGDVECDLNINHLTGVRNTALLQCYSKMDWRVAPLILIIKQWAKSRGINDASQGTLSSYSYALMIINYLQVGCKPPVLSSLQSLQSGDDLFMVPRNIRHYVQRLYEGRKPRNANQSRNTQGLFSLLKGFFEYYAKFHFESTVISVQQGDCYSRFLIPPDHPGWKQRFIFIEEPFDEVNTARSVFDWCRFHQIVVAFEETHKLILCKSDKLDISHIIHPS